MNAMDVALLFITNERNELLLSRRSEQDESDAGLWGPTVSGRIEAGETPSAAIIRESREELGLAVREDDLRYLHATDITHQSGLAITFAIYRLAAESTLTDSLVLDPNELCEVQWLSLQEVREMLRTRAETVIASYVPGLWEMLLNRLEA